MYLLDVYKRQHKSNKINNSAKKTALHVLQKLYTPLNNIAAPASDFAHTPFSVSYGRKEDYVSAGARKAGN